MKISERENEGLKNTIWDILLIADHGRFAANRRVNVEECEGATIITTHSQETAIAVLRTVAVDVIYNFTTAGNRQEAEQLRAYIEDHYPKIRVMDPWTLPSRSQGDVNHVQPLFLKEGYDCDTRRRMSGDIMNDDGTCPPELRVDSDNARKTKFRSTIDEGYAA